MSVVFSVLGWLAIIAGGAWVALAAKGAAALSRTGQDYGMSTLGSVMAMAPGFGLMFAGLLLLAIGAVVWHLARIDRNTGETADLLERLIPKKP